MTDYNAIIAAATVDAEATMAEWAPGLTAGVYFRPGRVTVAFNQPQGWESAGLGLPPTIPTTQYHAWLAVKCHNLECLD